MAKNILEDHFLTELIFFKRKALYRNLGKYPKFKSKINDFFLY